MKYRIAGIAAMVLVLLAVFLADNVDTENPEKRVHQHLTARQPDAGCDCDGTTLCTHLPLLVIEDGLTGDDHTARINDPQIRRTWKAIS